jgi:hypothetical protein
MSEMSVCLGCDEAKHLCECPCEVCFKVECECPDMSELTPIPIGEVEGIEEDAVVYIQKNGNQYQPMLSIGVQFFRLSEMRDTEEEAKFMCDMMLIALNKLTGNESNS